MVLNDAEKRPSLLPVEFLGRGEYRPVFPDEPPGGEANIAEIRFRGVQDGYVLLWSTVLDDLIAFHGTEAARDGC